jgi:eukaryotic-like serine/threonine-protein kinase
MSDIEADGLAPDTDAPESGLDFSGLTEFQRDAAVAADPDLEPGTRLGDLTIVRLVGEGGMGRVYEALQGMPCRTVAVKVMRAGTLSPVAQKRFVHEAQILGRLTHPGIARIYSVGTERLGGDAVPYFVMEYVDEALPITTYAARQGLSSRDRVRLFSAAAAAVAYGHQKGVIHRDLKPGNILVDAAGRPKIIDFGVARSVDHAAGLTTLHTRADQVVGTLPYMSPEQLDGSGDALDVRADVYALGLVLYELLAGRRPYDCTSRSIYEVARVVEAFDPHSLSTGTGRRRGELDLIVTKCLERDRGQRYSSAAELEADLGRHLRGEPIAASPPRLLDTLLRLARRHRLAATAAAAVSTAIVAAVVGIASFAVHAERQRLRAIEERRIAERETARADAEADTARRRLYIANMRSLQSTLDTRNRRTALERYADCLPPRGEPWPLELHCFAPQLDDSLAVIDVHAGPICGLRADPDGGVTTATSVGREGALKLGVQTLHWGGVWRRSQAFPDSRLLVFSTAGHDPRGLVSPMSPAERSRTTSVARLPAAGGNADDAIPPLAVSPDGRRMAVHLPDGRIRTADARTGHTHAILEGHRGRITSAIFSPDGRRLATLGVSGTLVLWDAGDGHAILQCPKIASTAGCTFSPDGTRFAVVSMVSYQSWQVVVYDAAAGAPIATAGLRPQLAVDDPIIVFAPDNRHLALTSHEQDLHLFDVDARRTVADLRGHTAVIRAVAFSPDGRQLATGATNGNIRLWDTQSFACERELIGHDAAVLTLCFCPGGDSLSSGSADGTVRVWARSGRTALATLPGVRDVTAVAFRPDGRQLAVAARQRGGVELWDPRTVTRQRPLAGVAGAVSQIAYSPDGTLVAATVTPPQGAGQVMVWNSETGAQVATLGDHGRGARTVAFSGDGSRLLTTSGDSMAVVWDLRTGRRLTEVAPGARLSSTPVAAVFGLGDTRIAFKSPELVDVATGKVATALPPQGLVTSLAVSRDGRLLAGGLASGRIYVTEFATGQRQAYLRGHENRVQALAFAPDGVTLASASSDGTARTYDVRTGTLRQVFRGHEGSVDFVTFADNGRRLVTAATDGTVRVWDATLGEELCRLPGQPDAPKAVALAPDGSSLVSGSPQGAVRIWGLSNADVVRARLGRTGEASPAEQRPAAATAATPPGRGAAPPGPAPDAAAPRARRETPQDPPGPAG